MKGFWRAATVMAAGCALVIGAAGPGMALPLPATTSGAALDTLTLTLISQELALAPDAPLRITFHPSSPLLPEHTIQVSTYARISERSKFASATDEGRFGGKTDSVVVDPTGIEIDGVGNVTVSIPTETAMTSDTALRLLDAGVHPVVVEVLAPDGERTSVVSELLTFVDRLPLDGVLSAGKVGVAVLATISAPPALPGSDPVTPLPEDVLAALEDLANSSPDVPLSLSISPQILGRVDPELLERLRPVLARSVVLSQPLIPFDPSTAAAADEVALFTQLLVEGEQTIAAVAEKPVYDRSVWVENEPMSVEGMLMLRNLGVRAVVISADTYLAANGNIRDYAIYSKFVDINLDPVSPSNESGSADDTDSSASGTEAITGLDDAVDGPPPVMPAIVRDPTLARRLVPEGLSAEQSAIFLAANLVVWRDEQAENISPVTGQTIVLALADGGVPNPALIARVNSLVSHTGAVDMMTLRDLELTTTYQLADGLAISLDTAPVTPVDISSRVPLLTALSARAATVGTMLVDDGGRAARWASTIRTLYSTDISSADFESIAAGLGDEFTTITECVVPPDPFTFTLNGRSIDLRLRLTNNCAETISVLVSLSASANKLTSDGPKVVDLPPGETPVIIPITARTNGTFRVKVTLSTPDGSTIISDTTNLTARVNALTGLAQVLSGGGLLVVLTWWVRHLRRTRRARRHEAAAATGHPARAGAGATRRPSAARSSAHTDGDTATADDGDGGSGSAGRGSAPTSLADS